MTSIRTRETKAALIALAALTSALAVASSAQAALTLTAAGVADGFNLSTFYSDPGVTYGLLGITTTATGQVIGTGFGRAQLNLFNDVNGQTPGSATRTVAAPGAPTSAATVGGKTYVDALHGGYYQVDPTTLALTPLVLDATVNAGYGLWGDQVTGHLIASTLDQSLIDIDPTNGHVHTIKTGSFWDGVSVSADGQTVYAAVASGFLMQGFKISDGTEVLHVASGHAPDGTGVISGTAFNGFVISNNNDGTVGLIDPNLGIETTIATGGKRGDLVGADLTNGTLFLADTDQVYRLGINGGTIGGGGVPESATWALMLIGFGGLGAMIRRRAAVVA